jgi:hypothetical protein
MRFQMRELNLAALAVQASGRRGVVSPFERRTGGRIVSGRLGAKKKPGGKGVPETTPDRVVLRCGADGALNEIPAAELGAHPRGLWVPGGKREKRAGGRGRWAKKR